MRGKRVLAASAAVLLAISYLGVQLYADHLVREQFVRFAGKLAPELELSCRKVHFDLFGRQAHLRNVTLVKRDPLPGVPAAMTIDDVTVWRYDLDHDPPHYAGVRVSGMVVPTEFATGAMRDLEKMGFAHEDVENLHMDGELEHHYDALTASLSLDRCRFTLRGWLSLAAAVRLTAVDLERISALRQGALQQQGPLALAAEMGKIQVAAATMQLEASVLTDRVLGGIAEKRGLNVQRLKNQTAEAARARLSGDPDMPPGLARLVAEFIRQPGSLEVTLAPESPVSLAEIAAAEGIRPLWELLNVKVVKY